VAVWLDSAVERSGSTAMRSNSAAGEAQLSSRFCDQGVLLLQHGHGEAEDGRRLGSSGTSSAVATACRGHSAQPRGAGLGWREQELVVALCGSEHWHIGTDLWKKQICFAPCSGKAYTLTRRCSQSHASP
jgi:hypothetical protein